MKNHLTWKVGFEVTPKLDPYWKSQPATYKVNMEWKLDFESIYKENSSWARISHGLNKLVTDLSNTKRTTATSGIPLRYSSKNLR